MTKKEHIYRITFLKEEEIYEIYARYVGESDMFGFIEIEEILFGEQTQLLVDPSEERLKNEFNGVHRTFVPVHSVIRIDEVSQRGQAKISQGKGTNIKAFPNPVYVPKTDTDR